MRKISIIFVFILIGVVLLFLFSNHNLEGNHIIFNTNPNTIHTFYFTPPSTDLYTFDCSTTFSKMKYSVYDISTNDLVTNNYFGKTPEGYYPFMNMELEQNNKYKVDIIIDDDMILGTLSIKLNK